MNITQIDYNKNAIIAEVPLQLLNLYKQTYHESSGVMFLTIAAKPELRQLYHIGLYSSILKAIKKHLIIYVDDELVYADICDKIYNELFLNFDDYFYSTTMNLMKKEGLLE